MNFNVVESFMADQRNNPTEARGVTIETGNLIGVMTASGPQLRCRKNSDFSAEVMQELLYDIIARSSQINDPLDLMKQMNARLIKYYNQRDAFGDVLTYPEMRMSANLLLINRRREELWIFGQGQYLLDGKLSQIKAPLAQILISLREQISANYSLAASDGGADIDRVKQDMKPFLVSACRFQNHSQPDSRLAFGVVDGFAIPAQFIKTIKLSDVQQIILASDGYPNIEESLAATEYSLAKHLGQQKTAPSAVAIARQTRPELKVRCYLKCERE